MIQSLYISHFIWSLISELLGGIITPAKQRTASKENSNCYEAASANNKKGKNRTCYGKLVRNLAMPPLPNKFNFQTIFPLPSAQQNLLTSLLTISNLSCQNPGLANII